MRTMALKLRHLLWLLPFLAAPLVHATPLQDPEYAEKNGQQHIHGNYNKWARNLAVDISGQLVQMPADAK